MKSGFIINLFLVLIIVLIAALPWMAMAGLEQAAQNAGCDTSGNDWGPGACQEYYGLAFASGWMSIAFASVALGLLGLDVVGVLLYFVISLVRSMRGGQPISPTASGMLLSLVGVGLLIAVLVGLIQTRTWVESSVIGACTSLPQGISSNGAALGPLAVGVRLPYPEGRPEQFVLLTIKPDGTPVAMLKSQPGSRVPAWSADGSELAFVAQSKGQAQTWGVYLAQAAQSAEPTISGPLFEAEQQLDAPAWSPDGQTLLLHRTDPSDRDNIELYSLSRADGSLRQLTDSPGSDAFARYSPDGHWIAFASQREGGWHDIFIMSADGSDIRRLTTHPRDDIQPAWSPDGAWIVFASSRAGAGERDYDLYIMAADGSNQCRLTDGPGMKWQPVWSPDGAWIAFINASADALFRLRPDGSALAPIPLPDDVSLLSVDWAVGR